MNLPNTEYRSLKNIANCNLLYFVKANTTVKADKVKAL